MLNVLKVRLMIFQNDFCFSIEKKPNTFPVTLDALQ